jgi:serine/threonine protein kinase
METVDHVYLVMEHVSEQQLWWLITQCLCEDEAHRISKHLVCRGKYCHNRGMVPRDLKVDILLDAQGKMKVIDFGLGTMYLERS